MNTSFKTLAVCLVLASAASAQTPVVGGLANHYSYIAAGLPNYGIAQGSIFDIGGTNLVSSSSATPALQDPRNGPLKSTLNGITVNVTVSGATTHPLLYLLYHGAQSDLIVAILPSSTAVGTGTVTVTTSAGTSNAFPIVVVQSALGIDTYNGSASGLGAIQDANNGYNLLTLTSSAKPGDAIVLWGTGLGPTTQDESQVQQQVDFGSNFPIEVDIGGVPAGILYHGRSVFPGLDEVIVTVPAGVSGCNNSVVVLQKANSLVSNVVTAPVAAGGGACSDPAIGVTSTVLTKCAASGCTIGSIGISNTTTSIPATTIQTPLGPITTPASTTTSDTLDAIFYRYTAAEFTSGIYGPSIISIGSCSVYTFSYSGTTTPTVPTGATATPLNAGTITATTPLTTTPLTYQSGVYYTSGKGGTLIPASGGNFSFSGSGGPDIGAFSANISLGAPLVWASPPTTVTRSNGLTVNWTGGTAGTYVTLFGDSLAFAPNSTTSYVGAYFWCNAPASDQHLTVPATVLLALPASGSITTSGITIPLPGSLSLTNSSNYATFTAPNLDYGYIGGTYATSESVTFQ